jgi:transcriptional regulator with XRE-family HTH domain
MELKMARIVAGFSQEEIAKKLKVSQPTVSYWERGMVRAPRRHLRKIEKITGFYVSQSMRDKEVHEQNKEVNK